MEALRYVVVWEESRHKFRIEDTRTRSRFGDFDTKFRANKRVDYLNGADNKRRARNTRDYGMRHPMAAPKPLAFKDD